MQKSNLAFVAVTPEAKALMEQILASNGSKEEIASRLEALAAGNELSSMNGGFDGSKYSVFYLTFEQTDTLETCFLFARTSISE